MKKKFDTLAWVRKVRDSHHEQQRGLSAEQKIEQVRAEAEKSRASRGKQRGSSEQTRKGE